MTLPPRLPRRMAGLLGARLPELRLEDLTDPRDTRGCRWKLTPLVTALIVGLATGCKSLADVESLTCDLSRAARRLLGLPRRVPDTTLRDLVTSLDPHAVRGRLHVMIRAAHRRKALVPDGLPFGLLAMDGKCTALDGCDDFYAQRQTSNDAVVGVLRTVTCALVSSRGTPVIDAVPLPASTNEVGHFEHALRAVCSAYSGLDLFRLVTYDAGACSEHNARVVRELGLHYLFGLKGTQPTLLREAEALLGTLRPEQTMASTEDVLGGGRRCIRRLYATEELAGTHGWEHLRMVLRVESETLDRNGQRIAHEDRFFASSLPASRLSAEQWLRVVRLHWGIENDVHHTLDTAFAEDDHPWLDTHPRGALVIALLRRIAYNLVALFRSVTQRSAERRATAWKTLLRALERTLLTLEVQQLEGLRARRLHC